MTVISMQLIGTVKSTLWSLMQVSRHCGLLQSSCTPSMRALAIAEAEGLQVDPETHVRHADS
jgi:hypothetical protein